MTEPNDPNRCNCCPVCGKDNAPTRRVPPPRPEPTNVPPDGAAAPPDLLRLIYFALVSVAVVNLLVLATHVWRAATCSP